MSLQVLKEKCFQYLPEIFPKKAPSQMFDRVLNTPLLVLQPCLKQIRRQSLFCSIFPLLDSVIPYFPLIGLSLGYTKVCNHPQLPTTTHNHPQTPQKTAHNYPQPPTTIQNHPLPPKNYSKKPKVALNSYVTAVQMLILKQIYFIPHYIYYFLLD